MSNIICIETSTTNCSVAIGDNKQLTALVEFDSQTYSHAEHLHVFIKQALKKAGISIKEIDAIAISKGPGSYTGLRIGVSTAKGLCYSLDKPLISIPTLKILAKQMTQNNTIYPTVAMIDARRMEVYSSTFDHRLHTLEEVNAKILNANSYSELFSDFEKINLIGNGVSKFKEICSSPERFVFVEGKSPSSKEMLSLARKKFVQQDFEDVAYFEPYYLKEFVGGKKG